MLTQYNPGDQLRAPGTTYRIEKLLGTGGMGTVYEATDKNLNRRVAIKLIDPASPSSVERFFHEARAAAQVRHPNVVRVEFLGRLLDETPFYVMEWLDGMSVATVLAHRPEGLRVDQAINIALQALRGLHSMHELGILHRDVKPENIMLHRDSAGTVLATVIDLGVMLLLAEQPVPASFGGTVTYAASEQILLQPLTPAADLFSLGLVLFRMLTGHRPYAHHGATWEGAVARAQEPAPSLSDFGEFPPALVNLLARMLDLDPRKRPRDGLAIIMELERISNAIVDLDLHEVATEPPLTSGPPVATAVRTITHADLANPTDPDANIPEWMNQLRQIHKRQALLGYAPTESAESDVHVAPRAGARLPVDTEPMAPPVHPVPVHQAAETPPARPARKVQVTEPMPARPRWPEATDPPRSSRRPDARPSVALYVDPPPHMVDPRKLAAALERGRVEAERAGRAIGRSAPAARRHVVPLGERVRRRLRAWFVRFDRVVVFFVALSLVVASGVWFVYRQGLFDRPSLPSSTGAP